MYYIIISFQILFLFSHRPIANPWKLTTAHNLSTNLDTRPWVETIFAKLNVPLCWMHWTPRVPPRVKRDHIRTFSSSQTPYKLQAFSETSVKSSTVRYFLHMWIWIQTICRSNYSVFFLLQVQFRGCQRCNFVLQSALNCLNLKWQLVEHVG